LEYVIIIITKPGTYDSKKHSAFLVAICVYMYEKTYGRLSFPGNRLQTKYLLGSNFLCMKYPTFTRAVQMSLLEMPKFYN